MSGISGRTLHRRWWKSKPKSAIYICNIESLEIPLANYSVCGGLCQMRSKWPGWP